MPTYFDVNKLLLLHNALQKLMSAVMDNTTVHTLVSIPKALIVVNVLKVLNWIQI